MISLKTLTSYLKFKENVEEFLIKRCTECERAEYNDPRRGILTGDYLDFEILDDGIKIVFIYLYSDSRYFYLPLDILFDDDFYEKLKARFDEERRQKAEETKERELKLLEELKRKYDS